MPRFVKRFFKSLLLNIVLPAAYKWHSRRPVEPKKCVFADARSSEMPESMRLMHEKCIAEGLCVRRFLLDFGACSPFTLMAHILRFMKEYATAGLVFVCDFYLPLYGCAKRPETVVVQLWHGCGALKKFGHSTPDDMPAYLSKKGHTNYSLAPVSAPAAVPHFCEAFRAGTDVVKPLGVSRTDVLFDKPSLEKRRADFLRRHPEAKGKKVLLYAPSFRGDASDPAPFPLPDFARMTDALGGEYALLVKLHPLMHKKRALAGRPLGGFIDCGGEDSLTLLYAADILVTDYSSILFEHALLGKAVYIYAPDYDKYASVRGFYIDYARCLPCPVCKTTDELIDAVKGVGVYDYQKLSAFASAYMSSCDGRATERIFGNAVRLSETVLKRPSKTGP